ncbi:MAG: glycosyltransferase family 9 protein [bacterium]
MYVQLNNKDRILNISGIYSLKQFFVVVKSVKLFISNDSGPLHVAVAYQTPTISFFGPETPLIYGPNYKKDLHKVFFMNLYCSPCISVFRDKNFVCTNQNKCMFTIQPEKVIQQVDYFLLNKIFK